MLLLSSDFVIHVVVAQCIFYKLSCPFRHTIIIPKFSDRQVWENSVNTNQTL